MNKLLSFLIAAWLVSLCYMFARADTNNSHVIWVYWDKDHDGFWTPGDVGLGGQEVTAIVFPCDPNDHDCVFGQSIIDGVTDSGGHFYFDVPDNTWGVAGCYAPIGCLLREGAIEFAVQDAKEMFLPMISN